MKTYQNDENPFYGIFYIKSGCLLFFSCWFSLACLTNTFDFIHALYTLPNWHFRSGNYDALAKVLQTYHTPIWFLNILFTLDILAQGISAILFFISFLSFIKYKKITSVINIAFGISMALWATFIIMEEIFIAYSFEGKHIRLLGFELLILLFIYLLPNGTETA